MDYHVNLDDEELAKKFNYYVEKYEINRSLLFKNWVKEWIREAEKIEEEKELAL